MGGRSSRQNNENVDQKMQAVAEAQAEPVYKDIFYGLNQAELVHFIFHEHGSDTSTSSECGAQIFT